MDSATNKRLAINTLVLYFRMMITIIIGLYTNRVVLQALGFSDYGLFNVVGGIIVLFSFMNSSLSAAASRFLTFELGKDKENHTRTKRIFGNLLTIHFFLACIIVFLAETIGLWFISNRLNIPDGREIAVFWVYQFSILSTFFTIISTPYNAAIIANERMSVFAYLSILDSILKLAIVYILLIFSCDKLILYSFLYLCIQVFDRIIYGFYCKKKFEESRTKPVFDVTIFREIISFIGWNTIGNFAVALQTQGINILLNIFFGTIINAARGIAVQVQMVVKGFCLNFQTALNPQIIKNYANGDLYTMHRLIMLSTKFSYYLLFIISLPLWFEGYSFLEIWLGDVPNHTLSFMRIILATCILFSISNPLSVAIKATGDIRKYQIYEGLFLLLSLPVSFFCTKYLQVTSEMVFIILFIIEFITCIVRCVIVLPRIELPFLLYWHNSILPIIKVTLLSLFLPIILDIYSPVNSFSFIINSAINIVYVACVIFIWGITSSERMKVLSLIKNKFIRLS